MYTQVNVLAMQHREKFCMITKLDALFGTIRKVYFIKMEWIEWYKVFPGMYI